MKYILGSGLIGFLAKHIYPEYHIIPIGKSRYYRYETALCDNYVFCNDAIDDVIKGISRSFIPVLFKRAISYCGQIIFNCESQFIVDWLNKAYASQPHPHAAFAINKSGFIYNVYGTDIFQHLEKPSLLTCKDFILSGNKLVGIDVQNKTICTLHGNMPYEHIISTVPLDYLLDLCKIKHQLQSLDLHTFIIETSELDFEGASELLVADDNIDFFKCTRISDNCYQFYANKDIENISMYVSKFIKRFNIISATCVRKAIPIGDPPQHLIPNEIYCVGSNAQWDDGMDISSCILRLLKLYNRI